MTIQSNSIVGSPPFEVSHQWDMYDIFGKKGGTGVRYFDDVDGDGEPEFVCSVAAEAHFAALDMDGNIVWENIQNTADHKWAYFPKVHNNTLYYGERPDTIYAINLSNGALKWSTTVTEVEAVELMDIGIAYGGKPSGSGGEVGVLDFNDGTHKSGWPVGFNQHEQSLGAGDLDGDGEDELVLSNQSGNIEVRNRDGTIRFTLSSSHYHVDRHVVANIDPSRPNQNELLTVVDDDGSSSRKEGDEIILLDKDGTELRRFETAEAGPSLTVANVHPDRDGLEVVFGIETSNYGGRAPLFLLDGTLSKVWEAYIPKQGMNLSGDPGGQCAFADVDGDGDLEIIVNTGEGNQSAGVYVFDKDGNFVGKQFGLGWNMTWPVHSPTGVPKAKHYVDFDGDGYDEFSFGIAPPANTSKKDVQYWLNRRT